MEVKETALIEKAKRVYGIDFQDKGLLVKEAENEQRIEQKEVLLKRLGVLKMSMESNKKNYQMQMKVQLK